MTKTNMETADFNNLNMKEPYRSFRDKGDWTAYTASLEVDGFSWWFNMEIPTLARHLLPLLQPPSFPDLSDRLVFLSEAVKNPIPLEKMENFCRLFSDEKDAEAAAAAMGAGIASIFDSGTEFGRFEVWYQRIRDFLKDQEEISPLARASLLGFQGMVELVYWGDYQKGSKSFREQLFWAEKARSHSLRVFHAAAHGYNLLYQGDLSGMELLLSEAAPLLEHPQTSLICRLYYQITWGIFLLYQGDLSKAEDILAGVMSHPLFDLLPPPVWQLGGSHFLLTKALQGDAEGVESAFEGIRKRTASELNHFHHSYIHFSVGLARLLLGEPYRALIHARQAVEKGRSSQSPIPERMGALLLGQALSDLGRSEEAMNLLHRWMGEWERVEYRLFASMGALELAYLLLKEGKTEEARKAYEKASGLLPDRGRSLRHPLRQPGFVEGLKTVLFPPPIEVSDWADPNSAPVRIQTFGSFMVQIGDTVLYDRHWRGGRTKALLKALIVCGGTKVSSDLLADMLWPDAEGDSAANNLKVAISRLRRTACPPGRQPLPWIVVKQRQISLSRTLCSVDAFHFQRRTQKALQRNDDAGLFMAALDLYREDFLVHDRSELWIIRHRELLLKQFITAVKALARLCLNQNHPELSGPYLDKALQRDPLDEGLYEYRMRAFLSAGYPGNALKVFREAKETFQRELGIEPGPVLTALARQAALKK